MQHGASSITGAIVNPIKQPRARLRHRETRVMGRVSALMAWLHVGSRSLGPSPTALQLSLPYLKVHCGGVPLQLHGEIW